MDIIAVIPARLASTRLPRKILREIAGRPMLAWVYQATHRCTGLKDVIVATDSEEIYAVCEKNSWHVRMTSPEARSGTERVHEVSNQVAADVYINVQGDEPLARQEHLDTLVDLMQDRSIQVGTLKTPMADGSSDIHNPNAVKVVTDFSKQALYFSRSTIPFDRDRVGKIRYFKHLGFYAYRKPVLDQFVRWPESSLELSERLEQLRFLENGIGISVAETPFDTVGVDTEEDLQRVEKILRERR